MNLPNKSSVFYDPNLKDPAQRLELRNAQGLLFDTPEKRKFYASLLTDYTYEFTECFVVKDHLLSKQDIHTSSAYLEMGVYGLHVGIYSDLPDELKRAYKPPLPTNILALDPLDFAVQLDIYVLSLFPKAPAALLREHLPFACDHGLHYEPTVLERLRLPLKTVAEMCNGRFAKVVPHLELPFELVLHTGVFPVNFDTSPPALAAAYTTGATLEMLGVHKETVFGPFKPNGGEFEKDAETGSVKKYMYNLFCKWTDQAGSWCICTKDNVEPPLPVRTGKRTPPAASGPRTKYIKSEPN